MKSDTALMACVVCLLAVAPVLAEQRVQTLADIAARLSANKKLCANFDQEKSLKALSRPLISTGKIVYLAGRGMLWHVVSPISSMVLIKNSELITWGHSGAVKRLNFLQSPVHHSLTKVFLAFFTGEVDSLEVNFDVEFLSAANGWKLRLIPKDTKMQSVIPSIRLAGNEFVETLLIEEAGGDETRLTFHHLTNDFCTLGKDEEAAFEF